MAQLSAQFLQLVASTPGAEQALSYADDTTVAAIASAADDLQTGVQNAQPAIDLAQTIASGGVPSEEQVVFGLTSVCSMINPIAGAAMGAIGAAAIAFTSGLEACFKALGLYSDPPPQYTYVGLLRQGIDPIPYGPSDTNHWVDISTWERFDSIVLLGHGDGHHPPISGNVDFQATTLITNAFVQLQSVAWQAQLWGTPADYYTVQTNFEQFFYTIFLKDMQLWANAQPFVAPKALLSNAATLWNSAHSSSSTKTFQGEDNVTLLTPLVAAIMGPYGDMPNHVQETPPLVIHTGPPISNGPKKTVILKMPRGLLGPAAFPAGSMTTTTKVVLGTSIVAGSALAGTALYAALKHRPFLSVWSKLIRRR